MTSAPSPSGPDQVPVLNIANILTVFRIVLVPVFVVVMFTNGGESTWWRIAAWAVFAIAMMTDYVDGWYARSRNLVTDFGKLADPIADKALMGAAMISLSILGELYWWVTIVILVREIGITVWRLVGVDYVVPASPGGKLKTAAQTLGIGLLILPMPHWVWPFEWLVMAVAVVLTVYTGVDYLLKARQASRAQGGEAS
ncbi:CDP-diacylglycerol--glycerol-3-phosphate 3-phosphatidyltransferase [Dietzia sp.]|uniref:CDP-diacylglycerol--glycerol-3-phosphate 3-phosphatidyltransferase n=1 Tax=Dietzia sp. TaxID=1871616 RepID=UPI002FD956F8